MSFGSPNNPYGQPQNPQQPQQPGYGYPQQGQQGQQGQQPYGYPQAPQPPGVPPQQGYGYPQAPQAPQAPQQAGYGYPQQPGYGAQPAYANWGLRFLSRLLDTLVYGVPYILVIIDASAQTGFLSAIGLLGMIGVFVWQVIQEGRTGQTLGKKAVGTRTVRESDGQPLGGGMAFVRQLAHVLDSLPCYLGYLWPAWDAKRQTFADKVCSSIVIRSR
jgi:uncharacterized RDD family membrane protein YckC